MITRDPDGAAVALLDSLRAGLTELRARVAAGIRSPKAYQALLDADPDLARDIDEAREEGASARRDEEADYATQEQVQNPRQVEAERSEDVAQVVRPPQAGDQEARRALDLALGIKSEGAIAEGGSEAPSEVGAPPAARVQQGTTGEATTAVAPVEHDPSGLRALAAKFAADAKLSVTLDAGTEVRATEVKRSKRAAEHTDDGAPDWERIREEATELAPGVFGWVLWQEERLAAADAGFPALSPFSLYTLENFFLSGKRWLLLLGGRGFGKSTFTGRVATAIGFGVERKAAPGPAWVCPIVSVLPVDADRRLEDIQQILLHAYLQEVKPAKSMVSARDAGNNALAWVSSASTLGNVSGPSSFAALVDEEEKILYGRAGAIVGSLAFTFRARPRVYGMRISSAMTMDDTLARACSKGNGPGAPLTNFVATLGPFVDDAVAGCLAVAAWEESRGNVPGAVAIRAHAATFTPDSWQIPTWLGHPGIGNPDERAIWTPGEAAVATRIEAEAVDEKMLGGLPPWRYWLREVASVPTGGEVVEHDDSSDWALLGEESRHAGSVSDDRGYGR